MVVFLANQFIGKQVATGGDILFVEILRRLSIKSVVIAPGQVHSRIQLYSNNVEFIDSDPGNQSDSASSVFWVIATVWRYLKRSYFTYRWLKKNSNENTVIYLTGDFICNTLPLLFMKLNGVKYEKICANYFHRNPPPRNRPGNPYWVSYGSRLLQGISLKIIMKMAQNVFVLSEIGKSELLAEGFDSKKIVVSGAGVNAEILKYRVRSRLKSRFVYLGRLNITKGAFDLIKILSTLAKSNSDFECVFIGHGNDAAKQKLLSMATKGGLKGKIIIKGFMEEEEKLQLLASATALAFSSKEEGYGIAVHEALYLGVPVVCYGLPVLKSLFGKSRNIHFVPQKNQTLFAKELERILTEKATGNEQSLEKDTAFLQTWDDVFEIQKTGFD